MLAKIRASGLVVCGANGMGFYNFVDGIWGCGFRTRMHRRGGNVAYISHSGSGMCGIVDSEERIDFSLVVSTGQELAVAMDEYLDFALDQPETRAVGLFMETARNPAGLVAAFAKARDRRIPIVALKVGRTELSARLTVSHSGAIAGQDAVYDAIFDRYGVHRARDMDELATTLILFAQPHPVGSGGLVSIHDSGGERQLLIDLAHDHGVPLTQLSPASTAKLEALLDPGLPAVNPLDAWSTGGPDYHHTMEQCFSTLMSDPEAAIGAVIHDRAPGGGIFADYLTYLRAGHGASGKPAFLVANRQGTGADPHDRRGDARRIPGAGRDDVVSPWRTPPPRSSRFHGARPRRCARDSAGGAGAHAGATRRPPPIRRERRPDAARRRRPSGQRRHHRRKRIGRDRGCAGHRLSGRAQDRETRPRPQERPAGHTPRARRRHGRRSRLPRPREAN